LRNWKMSDEMKILERVGERVAGDLGDGPSADRREAQKRAFVSLAASGASRRGHRPILVFVGVAAAASVAALLVVGALFGVEPEEKPMPFWVGEGEEIGSAGKWVHARPGDEVPIRFDNGSRMELEEQSAARVVESTQEKVDVNLSTGKLKADIKGNGKTEWAVNAGPYKVSVLGTEFRVDWNASTSTLEVAVTRGKVLVQGGNLSEYGIKLEAGKRLVANGLDGSVAVEAIRDRELQVVAGAGAVEEVAEEPSASTTPRDGAAVVAGPVAQGRSAVGRKAASSEKGTPSWLDLAEERDYAGAVSAAEEEGIDALVEGLPRDDLWKLANAARYARRPMVSSKAYTAVRDRFPGTGKAATAAFMLGRMAIDDKASPEAARKWFSIYLDEAPGGPLAEEALGRLMDACDKSGRGEEAKRKARVYLSRYQDGIFAKLAESILQQ